MSANKMATKADLQEMYQRMLPYLGGMPEAIANKFSKSDLYSTTEKIVGCWTDGKPLYQKTVVVPLVNATGTSAYIYGHSSNTLNVKNFKGAIIKDSDPIESYLLGGSVWDGTKNNPDVSFSIGTGNKIEIRCMTDWRGYTAYVTVQYTKTTDAANSFKYADENDYSTTEHIVGTWIDGKPIYQKTFEVTLPNAVTEGTSVSTYVPMGVSIKDYIDWKVMLTGSGIYGKFVQPRNSTAKTVVAVSGGTLEGGIVIWGRTNSVDGGNANTIQISNSNKGLNNTSGYLTVQYTKTTD